MFDLPDSVGKVLKPIELIVGKAQVRDTNYYLVKEYDEGSIGVQRRIKKNYTFLMTNLIQVLKGLIASKK
jgi:hypothetical protein